MSTRTRVIPADLKYIPSFYETLTLVARERIYIEMIEPPPLEKVIGFQSELIAKGGPVFYALDDEKVVGWCDVFPCDNARQNHRGDLGMGLLPVYRGKGIGSTLLSHVIERSRTFGLEKIELQVYTTNTPAIALYKKFGFEEEGLLRKYRKLDGQYFDCLSMAKFLD